MSTWLKGIDVSEWQGNIDWASVKKAGVQFAIIRCGLGSYGTAGPQADSKFVQNVKGCEANGIPYGLYYFCYACNENDVVTEYKHCKSLIDKYCNQKPFMVGYDFEGDTITKAKKKGVTLGKTQFNAFIKKWNEYFVGLGYQTPVYLNYNYYKTVYDKSILGKYPVWIASYLDKCIIDTYDIWQYSSSVSLLGMTVDGNYCTKEFIEAGTGTKASATIDTSTETKPAQQTTGGVTKVTKDQAIALTKLMLGHYPFTYCPTLAGKTSNRTPHKGDVVLFYNDGYCHTGLVYAVDSSKFYTIEGNTSASSGIVANGGGVAKKSYYTASYSSSKFYRPDYKTLVTNGYYANEATAIQAVINTATAEVGYLEKKSNSQLDDKTANAGSNNYTKYWRDIYPAGQAQPWCACFVTWCFQKAFEAIGTSGDVTTIDTSSTTPDYSSNNVASGMQKYKNGSTSEPVYQTSALDNCIGSLNPYEECYCFGQAGGAYLVAYAVDGFDNVWKAGYCEYGGKTTFKNANANDPAVGMQTYKNGSTPEIVYQTSACYTGGEIGCLNAYEECYCFGQAGGAYLVCYKVDDTDNTWKTGYVKYSGKTSF